MTTKEYKQLGCLDVAPTGGCAFQVRAESTDEVMRLTAEHAKTMHQMATIPSEMAAKVKSAIRSVQVTV